MKFRKLLAVMTAFGLATAINVSSLAGSAINSSQSSANAADPSLPIQPPAHIAGNVLVDNGAGKAGVNIQVFAIDRGDSHSIHWTLAASGVSGVHGHFDFTLPRADKYAATVVAASDTEVGLATYWLSTATPASGLTQQVHLAPVTTSRVRAVDKDGAPIAHIHFYPEYLYLDRSLVLTDQTFGSRWVSQTDADGWAVFAGLPRGSRVTLGVEEAQYQHLVSELRLELAKSDVTPDATVTVDPGNSVTGTVAYDDTKAPALGVTVTAFGTSVQPTRTPPGSIGIDSNGAVTITYTGLVVSQSTGSDGKFMILGLADGTYSLSATVVGLNSTQWVSEPANIVVHSDQDAPMAKIVMTLGGLITGRVTDKSTGAPLNGVRVLCFSGPGMENDATTGNDGAYQMRVAAGKYEVQANPPGVFDFQPPKEVTVRYGVASDVDFQTAAPLVQITLQGRVLGPNGKPAAGAEVDAFTNSGGPDSTTTDKTGRYAFGQNSSYNSNTQMYAHLGTLATAHATMPDSSGYATLKLAPNTSCTVHCRVVNGDGSPLSGAKVLIFVQEHPVGYSIASVDTDEAGKCDAGELYSGDYSVSASADGYVQTSSKEFTLSPGQVLSVPDLVLKPDDSFVGGTVVDAAGKPIAGADVSAVNGGNAHATTDANGKFMLKGGMQSQSNVIVTTPNGRSIRVGVQPGVSDNVIMVR